MRYDTYVQWYVDNCKCRNKLIKQRPWCTVCRLPHQHEQCLGSNIHVISYSYSIVDGICRRTVTRKLVHVLCPTQPEVDTSRCINNIYTITTTHYYYDNCRCRSRVERKTCHCKCGKDSKEIKCSRNYFLNEITTRYYKRDCRCVKTVNIRQIEPSCPRFIYFSVGKCNIQNHYSIYRKLTVRRIDRNYRNCKCVVVEKSENEVCSCRRRRLEIRKEITKRNFCSNNNNFVIQTWERRINIRKNKCEKVITHVDSKIISCPQTRIEKVCKVDRAIGKEITTKYNLVNCKCIGRKFARRIPCPCTPKQPVLKHRGVCNYITRRRIDVYWHKEARGKHCVTVIENKPVICKCYPNKLFTFCNYYQIVHIRTYYNLIISISNYCQRRNIVTYNPIRCSQEITKSQTTCYRSGFKFIYYYVQTVHNCRCIRRRIRVEFCRCRCPSSRIFRKCHPSGNALINTYFTYKHIGCSCKEEIRKHIQPIQCPSRTVSVSGCNEVRCRGYWFRTTTVTNYHPRHCFCVRNVQTIKSICKIKTIKEVSVTCDRRRRLEIRKESELILRSGKCVKLTKETRKLIACNNNWVIINRSGCRLDGTRISVYQRLYFRNCQCYPESRFKKCKCRCNSPFVVRKCERNINRLYYYRYELRRCKCNRQLIRVQTKRIYCKSKILKVGPCFEKNNHCVRNVEYQQSIVINCQCIKRRRIIQRICHSCCQHSTKTKTYCEKCDIKLITEVTSCWVNQYGRIIRTTQVTSKGVACDEGTTCVSQNDCDYLTSTETLKCTTKTLEKCLCVTKTEVIKKDLCMCGLPKLKFGACNLNTRKRAVYQIENKLVILRNNKKTCENVVRKLREEICSCPKSSVTKDCLNNRYIQKTEKYTFNEVKKTCESRSSENDITETCGPEREEFQGKCHPTTFEKKIKIIYRRLINCKCIIKTNVETELCRCPDSRTETKCVGNKLETNTYRYTLNNEKNKCPLTVDKTSKEIICPTLNRELFKLTINNVEQCRKTVYQVQNCQCVLVFVPEPCPCSLTCPKDTVSESCIHEKGVYRTINKNYQFNKEGCKCTENIKIADKQINCAETPRNVIVKAANVYENGIYDSVTTSFERRDNCECIKQSSTKFVLNRCYDGYINKSRSQNELYDYKCEKIPDIPPPIPTCPRNSTNSLGNGKSEETYYVIINNECVKRTTVVKCSECKIQYCTEDSNSCDPSKCSEDAVRALCPIKCGICEPCTSNESNCETNPYDDKQYRKK